MKSNIAAILTLLLLLLMEQITYGLFYSDLSFITASFFPDMDPKKLGYYAGYLISAFYLGQLPGSVFWGWMADKYGRKIPLCIVVVVDFICVFSFAFLRNFYVAVGVRFVWGFLDGHYPLIKTLMADYSTKENVARNSSFLFLSVAIGNSLAPLIGGYLSNPANLSEWLLNHIPILREKQFCFPFIICGTGLALCFIFVVVYIKETIPKEEPLIKEETESSGSIFNKAIIVTIILYGLEALLQCSYDSLSSLWLSTETKDGGWGWSAEQVGNYLCFVCPMQAMNLIIFPIMTKAINVSSTYQLIAFVQSFILIFTPVLSDAIVLIANYSETKNRGKLYGISQMLCGTGRFIGPPVVTSVFAWSIEVHRTYPLDHCLSYLILALVSFISWGISLLLPKQ